MNIVPGSAGFARTRAALGVALAVGVAACASLNKKERGAIIGAAAGGGAGAVIGNNTGSTARGAIIGAVVGGAAGAIIGHQMDQQAKELQQNIPGATVTRVGEGIAVTFASGLLYDFDSDVVRTESAGNLRSLAASLGKYPKTDLMIVGHTDAVGTSEYPVALRLMLGAKAADPPETTVGPPPVRTALPPLGSSPLISVIVPLHQPTVWMPWPSTTVTVTASPAGL